MYINYYGGIFMNRTEMSSYCEPDFNIYDEFVNKEMTEEERNASMRGR